MLRCDHPDKGNPVPGVAMLSRQDKNPIVSEEWNTPALDGSDKPKTPKISQIGRAHV